MSTHSHSTPQPAATGGTTPGDSHTESSDLTGGTPPVPITVWRTARTAADTPGVIGARLAVRIVSAYSQPGEAVVDLTNGHALTVATRVSGRRHHRAWFTSANALIVGPVTATDDEAPADADDDAAELELAAWFGDDLTDTLPPHGEPAAVVDTDASLAGQASLVVANWPLDASGEAANRVRLAILLAVCRRMLRAGGCLVLVVGTGEDATPAPEDFTPVVEAAGSVGLGYLQHIAAVSSVTDGDQFTYYATEQELTELAGASTGQHWYLHLRVHSDLLVFIAQPRTTTTDGGEVRG